MSQDLNLYLNLGALHSVGTGDLNADDVSPKGFMPGAISIMVDDFGFKMFRYGRDSVAASKGGLVGRKAAVTGTVTAAAGETNTTTHVFDTANFTAHAEQGAMFVVVDDAGAGGAAPEGEVSIIDDNTVDMLSLDRRYPITAACAAGDTYYDLSIWTGKASADGDFAINTFGIAMADRTALYYGWLQFYGRNPGTLYLAANAVTAGDPVVADAACVGPYGMDAEHLWVGHCPVTVAADLASPYKTLCWIDLLTLSQPQA